MSTVVILQPSYIPWIGYFEQIVQADYFIFYDDVQFTIRDWRTRNYIKTSQGKHLLSIPVQLAKKYSLYKIKEVEISYENKWKDKHLQTIRHAYSKSKYFEDIYQIIEKNINLNIKFLSELLINIIKDISLYLNLHTKFYLSSELNVEGTQTSRLVNICKYFNATSYYSGLAAKEYIDENLFRENNIQLIFQEYKHPVYKQLYGDFLPYLSIIDLLFNYGKESVKIISGESINV